MTHLGGRIAGTIALVTAALAVAAAPSLTAAAAPRAGSAAALPATTGTLLPVHAVRGAHAGIYDSAGRQVILRGVNLNSIGDYYQANPSYPPTVPVTDADWDAMAAQGFDVVRLIVSWSRLEPTKGTVDPAYLAEIHATVAAAAARGIYSVIDMHQDAWGKYIASPPGVVCPAGLKPAIGWDGAPQWATITDGADTCNDGTRENSEADRTAWDSFYSNRDGIRTELVNTWHAVAKSFAGDPAVAGYDLLNEPNEGHDVTASMAGLTTYYQLAIAAIRSGEAAGGGAARPIMFEYNVNGRAVPATFSSDPGLVFAPHNYGGSITPVPVSVLWGYVNSLAAGYHTAIWTGEYGWFADNAHNAGELAKYAHLEDANLAGSAWWQWRQACGDPHTIGTPGGTPPSTLIHYNKNDCPGDVNQGPVPTWQIVLSRPYLRAAPGRLVSVASSGPNRTLTAVATAAAPGSTVDLWVAGTTAPTVGGLHVAGVRVVAVTGGFRVALTVCGADYTVQVGAGAATAPAACPAGAAAAPTSTVPPAGTAATPVEAQPTFTG
jgi:endoglycosylceramidase